jgi:hypothetical protein
MEISLREARDGNSLTLVLEIFTDGTPSLLTLLTPLSSPILRMSQSLSLTLRVLIAFSTLETQSPLITSPQQERLPTTPQLLDT